MLINYDNIFVLLLRWETPNKIFFSFCLFNKLFLRRTMNSARQYVVLFLVTAQVLSVSAG